MVILNVDGLGKVGNISGEIKRTLIVMQSVLVIKFNRLNVSSATKKPFKVQRNPSKNLSEAALLKVIYKKASFAFEK